jgi:RsiW-degrading membrane proteinase PrsW (M82 family)
MDKQRLWGIPSWTIWIAIVIIIIFMLAAHCLYLSFYPANTSKSAAYWLKVGDALINGAIVGLFIAVVKTIIELPKWVVEFHAKKKAQREMQKAIAESSGTAPQTIPMRAR